MFSLHLFTVSLSFVVVTVWDLSIYIYVYRCSECGSRQKKNEISLKLHTHTNGINCGDTPNEWMNEWQK